MKPVKVKTVQVKAGPMKLASAGPSQPARPITSAMPPARTDVPETSSALVARWTSGTSRSGQDRPEPGPSLARTDMPPQPPGFGTGNGVLGVLPASSLPPLLRLANHGLCGASAAAAAGSTAGRSSRTPRPSRPSVHTGWIVQVGALESESEAQQRIEAARSQARGLLSKADPFTEPVVAKDNASCSAPASPALSAIRPRRSAGR